MAHFDRFDWDLLWHIWFSCVYAFIVFVIFPAVLLFVSAFIIEFPVFSTVKEMLPYNIGFSVFAGVVAALCEELTELKHDIERLKLANSAQVRE